MRTRIAALAAACLLIPTGGRAQVLEFESVDGETPTDGVSLSNQYRAEFGIRFAIERYNRGTGLPENRYPRFEAEGPDGSDPERDGQDAYECQTCPVPNENDRENPPVTSPLGSFFLKNPSIDLNHRRASLFILYDEPVYAASGEVWDVDYTEEWTVHALLPGWLDAPLAPQSLAYSPVILDAPPGDDTAYDGRGQGFSFSGANPIAAIRIDYTEPGGTPGLAFDNMSPSSPLGPCVDIEPIAWWPGVPPCGGILTNLPLQIWTNDVTPVPSNGRLEPSKTCADDPVPDVGGRGPHDRYAPPGTHHLDGTRHFVIPTPEPELFDLPKGSFTISSWVRVDLESLQLQPVVELSRADSPGRTGFRLDLVATNFAGGDAILLQSCDGGTCVERGSVVSQGVEFNDGFFHHVLVTFDASNDTMRFFFDGVEKTSVLQLMASPGSEDSMTIGRSQDGPRLFTGVIDELAIFDHALSTAQILALWQAHSASLCPDGSDFTSFPPESSDFADVVHIFGTGKTGKVEMIVSPCPTCNCSEEQTCGVGIDTTLGQTGQEVAAALAAAANAVPDIQAQGITLTARGTGVYTNGGIVGFSSTDAGLTYLFALGPPPVPSLAPALLGLVVLVVGAAAVRRLR